jgi:uroporphyrinogen decarboxylase
VLAALSGLPVDRVPLFLWVNPHAYLKLVADYQPHAKLLPNLIARLLWQPLKHGGIAKAREFWRALPMFLEGSPSIADYLAHLGNDFLLTNPPMPYRILFRNGHIQMRDAYGILYRMGGIYLESFEHPITDPGMLKTYDLPDLSRDAYYEAIRHTRRANPELCLCGSVLGPFDNLQACLIGTERMMMYLADYPEEMEAFMQRYTEIHLVSIRKQAAAGVDIIMIFDDYGYKDRTFISPRMWRHFVKPNLKRLVDAAHEAGKPVMLHSCGYQMSLLADYAELGIDLLQSFQTGAGNDFAKASAEYGDQIGFVTGIDTQRGELMSAEEFRQDILRLYSIGHRKPRFVLGMTHMLQYTMPEANVQAMFATVHEITARQHEHA